MSRDLESRTNFVDWRPRRRRCWPLAATESVVEHVLIITCLFSASISCQFEPNGGHQQAFEQSETRHSDNRLQSRLASSQSILPDYFEPNEQAAANLGGESGATPPVVYSDSQQQFIANLIRLQQQQQQQHQKQQQQLQEQLKSQLQREKNLASQLGQLGSIYSMAALSSAGQNWPSNSLEEQRQNRNKTHASSHRVPSQAEPIIRKSQPKFNLEIPSQLISAGLIQQQRNSGAPIRAAIQHKARGVGSNRATIANLDGVREFSQLVSAQPKAIDLAGLIKPGQTLLASRTTNKLKPDEPQPARESTSVMMGANQIETILRDLSHLGLKEQDKATGLMSVASLPNDSPDALRALALDERREQIEEAKKAEESDDLEDLLPNSRLFAGSSVSRLDNLNERAQKSPAINNDDEDQTKFLSALKTLSSQLAISDPGRQNYLSLASDRAEDFHGQNQRRPARPRVHARKSVPIELLVDHLMAGSRLATRRGDPTAVLEASDHSDTGGNLHVEPVHLHGEDTGDDDEEDEEEDDENGGGGSGEDDEEQEEMPGGVGETDFLAGSESVRNETRVERPAPEGDSLKRMHSNPIGAPTNTSTNDGSWKPVKGAALSTNQAVARRASPMPASSSVSAAAHIKTLDGATKRRRPRRKRHRRGRRARDQQESTILVGKKRLTRLELIRLIKVLSKLSNDKRPSEQRETSRKLLRHLIKVAIENYKRSQARPDGLESEAEEQSPSSGRKEARDRGSRRPELKVEGTGDLNDKRLRDSLRSLLLEPTLGTSNSTPSHNSPKVTILMQPWRERSALIQAQRLDGEEDLEEPPNSLDDEQQEQPRQPIDKDLKRPKTLVDLSDDLDRYFDTDFFEDLADKAKINSTTREAAEKIKPPPSNSQTATTNVVPVGRPVLLDLQQADEADEEDVDLDHVRLMPPSRNSAELESGSEKPKRRLATRDDEDDRDRDQVIGRTRKWHDRPQRKPANLSESRRRKSSKKARPPGLTRKRDRVDEETDPEGEEEEEEEDRNEHKRPKRLPEESRKRTRVGPRRRPKKSHSKAKKKGHRVRDENEKGQQEQEEREEEEEEEPDGVEAEPTKATDNQDGDAVSDKSPKVKGKRSEATRNKPQDWQSKHRARRRLKANRRKPQKNRDEIPAPIVSSRMSKERIKTDGRKKMAELESELDDDQDGAKRSSKIENKSSKASGKSQGKAVNKTKQKRIEEIAKSKESGKKLLVKGQNKKEPVSKEVVNYFNEGTEICEDGKCKLDIKSSHPKVVEQLKSNKSPGKQDDLVGKVDKWLQAD